MRRQSPAHQTQRKRRRTTEIAARVRKCILGPPFRWSSVGAASHLSNRPLGELEPHKIYMYRLTESGHAELRRQQEGIVEKGCIRPTSSRCPDRHRERRRLKTVHRLPYVEHAYYHNAYSLSRIDDIFDKLRRAKYYTKLDLRSGNYQIRLDLKSISCTAFRSFQATATCPR